MAASTFLIGPAFTGTTLRLSFAASDTSSECKNSADKISSKADASQSDNVCGIELSRDSPTITLSGKGVEFPYQPTSA